MNGSVLRDAFISAANNISNHKQKVNALNVFPVPDGDTGTNMSMTISAAKREVQLMDSKATVAEVSKTAASALLRGARGNSGVILSAVVPRLFQEPGRQGGSLGCRLGRGHERRCQGCL